MSHPALADYVAAMRTQPAEQAESPSSPSSLPTVTPEQSEEDSRLYRHLTLPNGMQVLLVSDKGAEKSAASMSVSVGHFSDPDELPGLAHFCEHMLFLGTEKYPDENAYQSFLNTHGGMSNAYTSTEHTVYYFDVLSPHLEPALDRFSAFFICPLFTASCVDRELNAVHSEHSKNLLQDNWRLFQLLKTTSNPESPFSKFGTGSHATLRDGPKTNGIDVREALMKFHADHYSAHRMRLVVVGSDGLDELQQMAVSKFNNVKSNSNPTPSFSSDAMRVGDDLGRLMHIMPIKDVRQLSLVWSIDAGLDHLYDYKPLELLSHLLGHEGGGSLLSYLKRQQWANGLSSGMKLSASSFALFTVSVDLTPSGLEHTRDVSEAIFSYIKHVVAVSLEQQPKRWQEEIYGEVSAIGKMGFRFKSKEAPQSLASSLAHNMHHYPPSRVLNGPWEYRSYDSTLMHHFIHRLADPSQCRVHVIAQPIRPKMEASKSGVLQERWYKTEYSNDPLPADWLQCMTNPRRIDELSLPATNEFVATNFALKHEKFSEEEIKQKKDYAPKQIDVKELSGVMDEATTSSLTSQAAHHNEEHKHENEADEAAARALIHSVAPTPPSFIPLSSHPLSSVWWKADRTYGMPRANLLLRIRTPLAYSSPQSALLSALFAQMAEEQLNEFAYNAQIAGLSYSFYSTREGLQLSIGGYNEKQPKLLSAILQHLQSLPLTVMTPASRRAFIRLQDGMKRSLENFQKENPYSWALFDELHATEATIWTYEEKLAVIDSLTPEQVGAWGAQLLAAAELDLFAHGNVVEAEVRSMANLIQATLQPRPLAPSQLPQCRIVQLPTSAVFIRRRGALNPSDKNSACLNLYQIGEDTVENRALTHLWAHIVREPLFQQLRTQEQLGYLVWSNALNMRGVLHWRVLLQSSSAPADYLHHRVEAFLSHYRHVTLPTKLRDDPSFIQRNIASLCAKKQERDKTLHAESNRLWREITTGRREFDRVEREVEALKTVTTEQLLQFIDRFIALPLPTSSVPSRCEDESEVTAASSSCRTTSSLVSSHRAKLSIQYFGVQHSIPQLTEYDTEESVTAANDPLPKEKQPSNGEAGVGVGTSPVNNGETNGDGDKADKDSDEESSIVLPRVPVDPRPIVALDDITAFKQRMPLFPAFE